jgi:hypothetical protein
MASMKTLFSMGFQAHDPFTFRHPSMGQSLAFQLGRGLSAAEIDQLTALITTGRQKLARVNAWIESKKAAQPFGWKLFEDEALQANFFNWMSTANSEEPSVNRVWEVLTNPSSPDYDVNQDDLIMTKDWAQMINWMTSAMEDYGGVKPTAAPIAKQPMIDPRTGLPIAPTRATAAQPSTVAGIPTSTLLWGGVAVAGAIALAAILKA